ncbi:hypothetical protein [Schlesneria sp. T3-172]|uniref:hypothetical protein n=1 Tax=Schlesneria sphaerica TaxID=3373610 RepID=UPI0037CC51BB
MRSRMDFSVRVCLLSAATAGLLSQSMTVYGQSKNPVFTNAKNPPRSGAGTSPVKATGDGKTEVQRQLEMLYEKDGREMPEMNVQPMTPLARTPQVVPAAPSEQDDLGPANVQPTQLSFGANTSRSRSTPARSSSSDEADYEDDEEAEKAQERPKPIRGFFKKLNPFSKKKSNSSASSDSQGTIPNVPPASGDRSPSSRSNSTRYGSSGGKSTAKLSTNAQKTGSKPVLLPVPEDAAPIPPVPPPPSSYEFGLDDADEDPLLELDRDLPALPDLSDDAELPPLPLDSSPRALSFGTEKPTPSPERLNPFSRREQEAEETEDDAEGEEMGQLVLPDQQDLTEDLAGSSEEEDPFAVQGKAFIEPPLEDIGTPPSPLALPAPDEGRPALIPAFDSQGSIIPEGSSESYTEKMRRIRSRFGMKGLKGFCPVTLKDRRELRDAKPEFQATFRGQKFHFASEEARDRFADNPAFYAPAAYGADVVALGRDKDVVEGTLDYAAWFQGRLYLFGNQENYATFVKSPATFATSVGEE